MSAVFSAAFFLSVNGLSILPDALTRLDGPLGPTALDLFVLHTLSQGAIIAFSVSIRQHTTTITLRSTPLFNATMLIKEENIYKEIVNH